MDSKIQTILKNAIHSVVYTKFLTIDEQQALTYSSIPVQIENCYINQERKRALVGLDKNLLHIPQLTLILLTSLMDLKHKDVLGAFMATGVKRETIGDIFIKDKKAYVFVLPELKDYFLQQITSVGKQPVQLEIIPWNEEMFCDVVQYQQLEIIVPSMRLDAIIAKSFSFSREKAKEFIVRGEVRINGTIHKSPDVGCNIGDILSVTRKGRIVIKEIKRKTKNDNLVLIGEKSK